MTPQQLKNSILQLAIQGKLVEQRPEEGTAEALYRDIQAEKARLVKEGKIKKDKPLPEIADDELPFDIPETWMWIRFGECGILKGGFSFKSNEYSKYGIQVVRISDLAENCISNKDAVYYPKSDYLTPYLISKNSFLICLTGSIGKMAWVQDDTPRYLNQRIGMYEPLTSCDTSYLWWFLHNGLVKNQWVGAKTSSNGNIKNSDVTNLVMPLPPLAEQKRIVARIEELLPLVDRYEQAWTQLQALDQRFPADLQKSILQLAIQGKLVEQRPEEGTAEALYRDIQAEKARLVKAGKIKKDKPLPEIADDELPFDIPESWRWCRIGKVFNLQAGKNITSSDIFEEKSLEHPFLCYGGNGIRGYVATSNRNGHFALIGRQGALCGNINFASGAFYASEHAVVVEHFNLSDVLWSGYFLRALNLNKYATATAQPGLAVANINNVLIPLPPLAEQKRIVARIEELLPLCEALKHRVS